MPLNAILAGCAITPTEEISDAVVLVEGGRILAVGRAGRSAHTAQRPAVSNATCYRSYRAS